MATVSLNTIKYPKVSYPTVVYPTIGNIPMPANFKYRDVLRKGRPVHRKFDDFWRKHPPMAASRWAKIFAPFDALDGFDERISEKEVLYKPQTELSDEEKSELNRRLDILHNLTWNSRMARENRVMVEVSYFVPCSDENHEAFQVHAGRYMKVSGMVLSVEMDKVRVKTDEGEVQIPFGSIYEINSTEIRSERSVFDTDWDLYCP